MEFKNKHMVVDALIKVVDASPVQSKSTTVYSDYNNYPQRYNISMQEFSVWMNYVNSVLNVAYQYTGIPLILTTQQEILAVSNNYQASFAERTLQIERIILNLAQTILHYQ